MKLRIREYRMDRGWSLEHLAEKAGISRSHLNQIELGLKRPNTDRLEQIARALDVSARDLISDEPNFVPILGRVAAGTEEILMEGQGEAIGEVALPDPLRGKRDVAAVLVEGESMRPLIEPGSVLFFRRHGAEGVPAEAIGRVCVSEDADGRVWVKQVTQGTRPDLFNLVSINPAIGARLDAPLRWAAPILMWLPPELVLR